MSTEEMALTAPLPITNHCTPNMQNWTFGRYNPMRRTGSPTREEQPQLRTLESLAAELSLYSTSPTAGFSYLTADYYTNSTTTTVLRTRYNASETDGNQQRLRTPIQKSRSFPKVKKEQCITPDDRGLRKTKSFKTVRFADTQGLPLIEAVHQLTLNDSSFTENEIVPYGDEEVFGTVQTITHSQVVAAASKKPFSNSKTPSKPSAGRGQRTSPTHKRTFKFTQPGVEPGFYERVNHDKVALESIREESRSIHGVIRVANISYHKEVTVRWSHDNWRSHHDTHAVFCANDGATDRFTFELPINGDDLLLAMRYQVEHQEYWDNNRGKNYLITSEPLTP